MLPRLPTRRFSCAQKYRFTLRNFGWIVLAAALPTACSQHPSRVLTPPPNTAAASRTSATSAPTPDPARSSPPTLPANHVGTVRAIGPDSRFVLLETVSPGGGPGLATGQELRCLHAGAADASGPFALLRVSRERRPPFIVADVVSGQPLAGDDVYAVTGQGPAPLPVPASTPSAASLLIPPAALPPTTR